MNSDYLKPGSKEAIKAGCTCPRLDNHNGKGYHGVKGIYCMQADCPIHGIKQNVKQTKRASKKRK